MCSARARNAKARQLTGVEQLGKPALVQAGLNLHLERRQGWVATAWMTRLFSKNTEKPG
jgi:hypothetical protein